MQVSKLCLGAMMFGSRTSDEDSAAIIDRATYEEPLLLSEGVHHVLVNGQLVLRDGQLTGARPGRALR